VKILLHFSQKWNFIISLLYMSCCKYPKNAKTCKRTTDGKIFDLPRRFTRKQCANVRGFTMRSSCAPYKGCGGGGKFSRQAVAVLAENNNGITGKIFFTETKNKLKIEYEINGLTDGKHGFHIHEYGDLTDGCKSACSHFNPFGKQHGGLNSSDRHAGDLGNIISNNGVAKGVLFDKILSLDYKKLTCIVGRMIIVHKDEDDLGLGGNEESLKTGNAGERVACGVIGLKSTFEKSGAKSSRSNV
jgi:Cu-Zn family superoxide dismutase